MSRIAALIFWGLLHLLLAVADLEECIMGINWKVRLKSKTFWLSIVPAVLLLVQVVAAVFGFELDLGDLGNRILDVVNALFAVLAILGVVTDPTTEGVGDSEQALTYTKPKSKGE